MRKTSTKRQRDARLARLKGDGPRQGRIRSKSNKEKPGTVRRGCVRGKKHRPHPDVKQGRPVDPSSERQGRLRHRELKSTWRVERMASIAQCTWSTSTKGGLRKSNDTNACCSNRHSTCGVLGGWVTDCAGSQNAHADIAAVIGNLRRYIVSLDESAWRKIMTDFTFYKGYEKGRVAKHKNQYDYFLPSLQTMQELLRTTAGGGVFPTPAASSLRRVCGKWFFFATGVVKDTFFDGRLRKNIFDFGRYAKPRDLDISIRVNRGQEKQAGRSSPMRHTVINFLKRFGDVSCALPNQDHGGRPTVVVATRTILATHRLYVHEMEREKQVCWVRVRLCGVCLSVWTCVLVRVCC